MASRIQKSLTVFLNADKLCVELIKKGSDFTGFIISVHDNGKTSKVISIDLSPAEKERKDALRRVREVLLEVKACGEEAERTKPAVLWQLLGKHVERFTLTDETICVITEKLKTADLVRTN